MGRVSDCIERDAAKKAYCRICFENSICYRHPETCQELKAFDVIPAADVRPAKRGKWIEDGYYDEPCVCSYCGEPCTQTVMGKPRWNYCPFCGADMREPTVIPADTALDKLANNSPEV